MAIKTVPQYFDDLDKTELSAGEVTTIRFGIDGKSYMLDLSAANAETFQNDLARWVEVARRDTNTATPRRTASTSAARKQKIDAIRTWATENGYNLPSRGRIPKQIENAYDSDH